jgi:CRISPR-associated protein Cmr3
MNTLFLEPLDVLFLRGNKLFGDAGSYGESLVPPWPSVAAGAIRSRMLADTRLDGKPIDLAAFARGEVIHPELGTPASPGTFAVAAFHLARRLADGRVEILVAPPADLVVSEGEDGAASVRALAPQAVGAGAVASSSPFAALPVLAETTRGKPATGYWLTEAGWRTYLAGRLPTPDQLVRSSALWAIDARVGVGLDAATRRASDGRLFTVQAVAMRKGVGFLAAVTGAEPPQTGSVRLGGDGRAAAILPEATTLPEPDYATIAAAKRCRLVLATPGIFALGWLPTGVTQAADGTFRFDLHGVQARLVCAAVPRAETVSGWDLARWQPKPAERAAPAGSVYWLDELDATAEALRNLVTTGLWSDPCEDAARRAEGFNRFTFAAY